MNLLRRRVLLVSAIVLWQVSAIADSEMVSVPLRVAASVPPNCKISISDLSFGVYDPLLTHSNSGLDATATLTITCTRGTAASILVDGGLHGNAGAAVRQMSSGSQKLSYQIYSDSSRSTIWSPGHTLGVVGSSARSPDRLEVYGRILPGQAVLAGSYSDRVTATVEF